VLHRQLVALTVTSSLQSYWILLQRTPGILTPVGNSNMLTRDFFSVRLSTQGMTYPGL
jgi:hypothetical protein